MFLFGFLEYLSKKAEQWSAFHRQLKGAAGVSSGTVVALAMLVGVDIKAMCDALVEISRRYHSIAPSLDVQLAFDAFGLDDGLMLQQTIDEMLDALGLSAVATFASLNRLTNKDFRVVATNADTMHPVYFSHTTTPQMPVRDAIYMSMTVPFIFKPRRWMGELHVDGGMLQNYPVHIFEGHTPFLFFMDWDTTPAICVRDFAFSIVSATLHVQLLQLEEWRQEHPNSVCALRDSGRMHEGVSLSMDTDALQGARRRGFIQGMMSERDDLITLVSTLITANIQAKQPEGAAAGQP
jgi:predicted acylesterase/phospholipase RssA